MSPSPPSGPGRPVDGSLSLLSILPASRLPKYVPDELSADDIVSETTP